MSHKYYAVVSGVVPGIYTDWPTTQRMVKGYPGALFKSFSSRAEAEEFIEKSSSNNMTKSTNVPHVLPLTDKNIIYTDGSFNDSECGFGVIIITPNGEKITAYGKVPHTVFSSRPTNNVAELYAIYVGLSLAKGDAVLYSDSRYSVDCLTTRVHDWVKNGWGGVANSSLIFGIYNLMKNRNITLYHIYGHSNIGLNNEVDSLANKGRMQSENLVVLKNNERIV